MDDAPPEAEAPLSNRAAALALALMVAVAGVALRQAALESAPAALIAEVRGEVPNPGFYPLSPPATVHDALRAAGRDPAGLPDGPLPPGSRLVVEGGALHLEAADAAFALGEPVDLNTASAAALAALPGLTEGLAQAIVDDRQANGPFSSVAALDRVKGVGPATVEQLRPYVIAGAAP